ncbi:MAG: hypothetical protein JST11_19155 [Acidobacteria bacterium]|nr:hypothetical protein [Acidobacteriota bacterium]
MAQIPLNKTIDAKKVNKRTGAVMPGPEATIPFGALVEMTANDRGMVTFSYMMELYRCTEDLWRSAAADAPIAAPASAPAPAAPPPPPSVRPDTPRLQWQDLPSTRYTMSRAKVPGGWLIALSPTGITFYPDPRHKWDGLSLE